MMNRSMVSALALLLSTATLRLDAQDPTMPTSPDLVNIIRLAQEGYADSARALLKVITDRADEASPLYPEALFTGATIARSGDEARLLFSRVAVMHSTSPWADKALLRLAQLDYGTGDTEAAVNRITRLATDYPESAVFPDAMLWGARAAFERRDTVTACDWLGRGLQRVGSNIELKNQIEFTKQRCPASMASRSVEQPAAVSLITDSTPRQTTPPAQNVPVQTTPPVTPAAPPAQSPKNPDPAPPSGEAGAAGWRIQLAAVSDPAAITRTETAIRRAGLTPYRVPAPNGLTRVQAGPFATREAAQARLDELKRAVGGAPFVVRVD